MTTKISTINENGDKVEIVVTTLPDECPICHMKIKPEYYWAYCDTSNTLRPTQVVYKCPNSECGRLFFAYYALKWQDQYRSRTTEQHKFSHCEPTMPSARLFGEEIQSLSPGFCDIYNEARAADQLGLKQVCGSGYRKSLEFLIKDYVVSLEPDATKHDKLKEMWLGRLIDSHVTDGNVKKCASRAAWLGNDETHYVRIWEDKDLTDLKTLIDLTLHWIESSLLTKSYSAEMDKK